MKIHYEIFKDKGLWVQKNSGIWSTEIFEEYIKMLVKEPDWKYVTTAISDFREADLSLALKDFDNILNIRQRFINNIHFQAFIVNTPTSTASIHLYNEIVAK